jgi:gluconokinase
VVVMGVSGCGKSSLGAAVAARLGLPLVEGDDHHPPPSRDKMRQGIALTDDDRAAWLDTLAGLLASNPSGVVLTCSALKKAYRERLRSASPGLRFVFLDLDQAAALSRVAARAAHHFFPPGLVANQFETLEPPHGEPGVLVVDATAPIGGLAVKVCEWLDI